MELSEKVSSRPTGSAGRADRGARSAAGSGAVRARSQPVVLASSGDAASRSVQGHLPGGRGAGVEGADGLSGCVQWPQHERGPGVPLLARAVGAGTWSMQHHPGGSARNRLKTSTRERTKEERMTTLLHKAAEEQTLPEAGAERPQRKCQAQETADSGSATASRPFLWRPAPLLPPLIEPRRRSPRPQGSLAATGTPAVRSGQGAGRGPRAAGRRG
jgi:hypothetical protein